MTWSNLEVNFTIYQLLKLALSLCKSHILRYCLAASVQTPSHEIVNHADGWLPIAGFGPLEQLEQAINGLREAARKANKNPSNIRIVVLSYPNVLDSYSQSSSSNQQRSPMSGTIDQIGTDIDRIKAMGAEHIIFAYAFSPIGKDVKKMMEVTKQLARFAR